MPALPGAPPSLSPGPSLTPLPGPGSALDSPASLLTEKGRSWARTLPLSPASTCHLPPQPQWARPKCVCVREWARVRLSREISAVVVSREYKSCGPHSPWSGESPVSFLCSSCVCVAAWLAGGICLSVCCPCAYAWGRSAGAPSPRGPRSVYAGAPKPALCPHVLALWFCVCVCFLVLWPVCLCALRGCAVIFMSLHHPCVHVGFCLSILPLVLCPWLSQREGDSAEAPPINLCQLHLSALCRLLGRGT